MWSVVVVIVWDGFEVGVFEVVFEVVLGGYGFENR
jgi:hypothetical protein